MKKMASNVTVEVISIARAPMMVLLRLRDLTNDTFRGDVRDDGTEAGSVLRERLEHHIAGLFRFTEDDRAVILRHDDRIVGWAHLAPVVFDRQGDYYDRDSVGCNVYVHPDHRRQGLGTELLLAALKAARATGAVNLLAYPWNAKSHRFYESLGFVHCKGRIVGKNWIDVVFMYDLCNMQKAVV